MSDRATRSLERAAAEGDPEAAEALRQAALREVAAKWAPTTIAPGGTSLGLLHLWLLLGQGRTEAACGKLRTTWPESVLLRRADATRENRWRCHACERYALREGIALAGLSDADPNRHGRRRHENGRKVAPEPCDAFRESNAPGYCWCGWWRERHAEVA